MRVLIGIDCGVNTGFAVAVDKKLSLVTSFKIHEAMDMVREYNHQSKEMGSRLIVYVEDARKRSQNPRDKRAMLKQQGVGSVKRDAKIWEDFLKDEEIEFVLIDPKTNKTKLDANKFKLYTGFSLKTNEHGRDAAMLIFER